jgi:hypothetical protein
MGAVSSVGRSGSGCLGSKGLWAKAFNQQPDGQYHFLGEDGQDKTAQGMLNLVIGEIPIHRDGPDWKASLRTTINSARQVILRHPWAPRVIRRGTIPVPAACATTTR